MIKITFRAERDRGSIYNELQQTRGAVDQIGREKVARVTLVIECLLRMVHLHLTLLFVLCLVFVIYICNLFS